MIQVTSTISIPDREVRFEYVRSSGPGGQNVNKVATAVQLRFDIGKSSALPPDVRQRLRRLAGKRVTEQGVLIIDARRHRTQERNRHDATQRLIDLIRKAAVRPVVRRKTRASWASRERRLTEKQRRGNVKRLRKTPGHED